jgi:hypothetical protein
VRTWPRCNTQKPALTCAVAGYLTTAGRVLPVATARTLLAGWNPDETYWLADVITACGEPRRWRNDDRGRLSWHEL